MDFSFSEEQSMLQDSVQRFMQNSYTFENRQKLIRTEEGFSRENWASFAELGWLAMPFPESVGGFGGIVRLVTRLLGLSFTAVIALGALVTRLLGLSFTAVIALGA